MIVTRVISFNFFLILFIFEVYLLKNLRKGLKIPAHHFIYEFNIFSKIKKNMMSPNKDKKCTADISEGKHSIP